MLTSSTEINRQIVPPDALLDVICSISVEEKTHASSIPLPRDRALFWLVSGGRRMNICCRRMDRRAPRSMLLYAFWQRGSEAAFQRRPRQSAASGGPLLAKPNYGDLVTPPQDSARPGPVSSL